MGGLSDKIAIVTAGGEGIGRAIADKLAAEGATVAVTDLVGQNTSETADGLPGAVAMGVDPTDRQGVQAMADQVVQLFGRIDVLVNNAGWDKASPFVDSEPGDWDRAIAVNLYGVLHTCKAVLPIMAAQGSGAVVNLGSDAGRVGSSGEAVYSAAKGGVIAFTKSLAREMARHQVRVNCVCPGPTDTALFASFAGPKLREALTKAIPFRRLGEPADVANVVAFLASDEASFVTGQTVSVRGGLPVSWGAEPSARPRSEGGIGGDQPEERTGRDRLRPSRASGQARRPLPRLRGGRHDAAVAHPRGADAPASAAARRP